MILNTLQARLPPENIGTSKGQTLQKPKTNDLIPPPGRRGASTLSNAPPSYRKNITPENENLSDPPKPTEFTNACKKKKKKNVWRSSCMRAVSAHRAILSDTSIPAFQLRRCRAAPRGYLLKGNHSPRRAGTLWRWWWWWGGGAAGVSGHICRYIRVDCHRQ